MHEFNNVQHKILEATIYWQHVILSQTFIADLGLDVVARAVATCAIAVPGIRQHTHTTRGRAVAVELPRSPRHRSA